LETSYLKNYWTDFHQLSTNGIDLIDFLVPVAEGTLLWQPIVWPNRRPAFIWHTGKLGDLNSDFKILNADDVAWLHSAEIW